MTFTIVGEPQGKARPRVTSHGTFTPKKTKDYEQLVRIEFMRQCRGVYFFEKAIAVEIIAYYKIPKSTSKSKFQKMEQGSIRPKIRCDIDNVMKLCCDALNGLAYRDDAQIVEAHLYKFYSEEPRVIVKLSEVNEDA